VSPAVEGTSASQGNPQGAMPDWATWAGEHEVGPYSVGVEEEVMLLEPGSWELANRAEDVLSAFPVDLGAHLDTETHSSVIELQTGVHPDVEGAIGELRELRRALWETTATMGMRPASAGTHPTAEWKDVVVSGGDRSRQVYRSMRELARREPTFALHVHIGLADPETAIRVANRLRVHQPLLLALSANSPFWQGRDTGLASARTPVFQAFPRVGVPRGFESYGDYVEAVDLLIRSGALPEPTFLWWDVRPQPRFGTVEVRIMDAQTRVSQTGALVALVQSVCRMEAESGYAAAESAEAYEALVENRFLAARDGIEAVLIEPELNRMVPAVELLADLLAACAPHARELGCEGELARVHELSRRNGSTHQLAVARRVGDLPRVLEVLSEDFCA
jgi:glutamate---cysteine ligase / carboxylate-amine ligase